MVMRLVRDDDYEPMELDQELQPPRPGADAIDDDLEAVISAAVWGKELKHHVNDPGFVQPLRTMSAIGG